MRRETLFLYCWLAVSLPTNGQQTVEAGKAVVLVEADSAGGRFGFLRIPLPAVNDTGRGGLWRLVTGHADANSGGVGCLSDGRIPLHADDPGSNFFLTAGMADGLLALDLQKSVSISEVVSYSWHAGGRAAQVYTLYGATGDESGFTFPESVADLRGLTGWTQIAVVDSRQPGTQGGQHAVRLAGENGLLGNFRHLLFHVRSADPGDRFGQTFFSEIDVVTGNPAELRRVELPAVRELSFGTADNRYEFSVETTQAQELEEWTELELKPVIVEWYPRIVRMLPGDGFEPPRRVRFRYLPDAEMQGVPAYAAGSVISLNREWFRGELQGEARGCVVHEMVHVVQQYPARGRRLRDGAAVPGWLVEGIPDYIRWFVYEPKSGGASLSEERRRVSQHDASYRVSANFLDWVIRSQPADAGILWQLNAAAREGRYSPELWQTLTGKSEQQLAEAWRTE